MFEVNQTTGGARRLSHPALPASILLGLTSALLANRAQADALSDLAVPFQEALAQGRFGWALVLVFGAGLATALTPCVYPMIAITVSVFGARQEKSRARAALLSGVFVLGIAAFFTPLGILSASSGVAFGSALANRWVVVALALLFVAMALSMFGLFELRLPAALQNRLARVGGMGMRGAFMIGFVNGLIAAPCTGPVLAVLLTWVATTGNATFGAVSLFVYALGLGVLFFIVGTFAIALPKSGRWLDGVKSLFGIVMLVLAVYFTRGLVDYPSPDVRALSWLAGAVAIVAIGVFAGALHLSFAEGGWAQRLRKGVAVGLCVVGLLGVIGWVEAVPAGEHIVWRDDYAQAKTLAAHNGQPLMVDFGADWCGACNELEKGPLSDPRVVAEAKRFVTVRVDLSTDQATADKWALLKDYNQPGLPFIVFHGSDGRETSRITGYLEADELLEQMSAVR